MDTRKETFGRVIHFHRGFFDVALQEVLCQRRRIDTKESLESIEERFHLAWPLMVLSWIDNLQITCRSLPHARVEGGGIMVLDCYRVDPVFTSELLLAVTRYSRANPEDPLERPETITIQDALMEYETLQFEPGQDPSSIYNRIRSEKELENASPACTSVLSGELVDWKTVATKIGRHHPHLKQVAKADLLKAYFHKEKRRRERIYNLWSSNLNAFWGSPPYNNNVNWLSLFDKFPSGPNLDYYARLSVTKKSPK